MLVLTPILLSVLAWGFAIHGGPSMATRSSCGGNLPRRRTSPTLALQQFVADAEKEDVHNNKGNGDNETSESSWIPTSNGGFLPKLRGKTKHKVLGVTSLDDYKREVAQEEERLVVVRFYAPWCRACKAIANSFHQLPKLYPDVKFVEVPLTKDTGVLHTGLGVPSLPFGHIYHPDVGLVEERRISRPNFKVFRDEILQSYVDGSCRVQYDDDGATNRHAAA